MKLETKTIESGETAKEKPKKVDLKNAPEKPGRDFRDAIIGREEKRWNTPEKQEKTISAEKKEIEKFLATDGNLKKIADMIRSHKEDDSKEFESFELPGLLRKAGVDEKFVKVLEDGLPESEKMVPPKVKHFLKALVKVCNVLKKKPGFKDSDLEKNILENFETSRRTTFVQDDTVYQKSLDSVGQGFYSSEEGQNLIQQKATKKSV